MLPKYFDGLEPDIAIKVLGQTPHHLLWEARPAVGQLLNGLDDPIRRRQLVRTVMGTGENRWLSVLAAALIQRGGKDWCPATLKVTCDKLAVGRMGEKFLIPLIKASNATEEAILAALRALEGSPEILRKATKFRLRELNHSKEVRQRLRKARKQLREEG